MEDYVTPEQLGSNATDEDVESFVSFANEWAEENGYDIEFVAGEGKETDETIEIGNMAFEAWNSIKPEEICEKGEHIFDDNQRHFYKWHGRWASCLHGGISAEFEDPAEMEQIMEAKGKAGELFQLKKEFAGKEYEGYDGKSYPAVWWIDPASEEEYLRGETDCVKCYVESQAFFEGEIEHFIMCHEDGRWEEKE